MYKYVLFGAAAILFSTLLLKTQIENFMVEGTPIDPIVKPSAAKAYYNEMSNAEFEELLHQTFPYPCYKLSIANDAPAWDPKKTAEAADDDSGRDKILKYVEKGINANAAFKDPNLVDSVQFQIVDYKVVGKWRHKFQPLFYKYRIKVLVYREGKYHGKQLLLTALVRGSVIDIVQIAVIGIVFEDKIALYPVAWANQEDNLESDAENYQTIIFDNDDAQKIIDRQHEDAKTLIS